MLIPRRPGGIILERQRRVSIRYESPFSPRFSPFGIRKYCFCSKTPLPASPSLLMTLFLYFSFYFLGFLFIPSPHVSDIPRFCFPLFSLPFVLPIASFVTCPLGQLLIF